ncbi:MAG: hypothetical protein EXR72_06905 [Myxococcales bacterium]|nr:hypothetical protein [Myxococcales bacterium]
MAQATAGFVPKGGVAFGIVVEAGQAKVQTNLNSWIAAAKAPHTYANDSTDSSEDYFQSGRDHWVIIDLKTMKIVDVRDSDAAGAIKKFNQLLQ